MRVVVCYSGVLCWLFSAVDVCVCWSLCFFGCMFVWLCVGVRVCLCVSVGAFVCGWLRAGVCVCYAGLLIKLFECVNVLGCDCGSG